MLIARDSINFFYSVLNSEYLECNQVGKKRQEGDISVHGMFFNRVSFSLQELNCLISQTQR